jgi:hypothetical protein
MRFLNVYPKRILASLNTSGTFEGQFTFNIEQYGLQLKDTVCDITISENPAMRGQWRIQMANLYAIEMPHFEQFVKTLNHYVFDVLQFNPSRSANGKDLPGVKLFFDEIYFDMSGAEPVVQKRGVKRV